jgi:phage tail sheath protein FI
VFTVRALPAAAANDISVEVVDASEPTDETFKLVVKRAGAPVEEFDNVTARRGAPNSVATVVRERSQLITVEETRGRGIAVPVKGVEVALAGVSALPAVPARVRATDYVGDSGDRTGFAGLEAVDEVTMLCVPDLMAAYQQGILDAEGVRAVQLAMIAHCEGMGDRMAILDPPPGLSPQQVRDWRTDVAGYDSKYAALYYPWIKIHDPGSGTGKFVPPSGHMAGVWARSDGIRGVHKAPANEVVRGALNLQTKLTKGEQELLNPLGVNCIRSFPGRGIRVWGARTLSSDAAWSYLNVRRLFNYLEESILNGTQWVVFEPNDDALWARIRRTIGAFLVTEWRKGALFGLTPDEAFFVKCDRETNPAESIAAGQVLCEVGIAPVKPAEFVIFRMAQISGGTSLVNE